MDFTEYELGIVQLCLSAGLNTQQKAADYFEISVKTWQRWIRNKTIRQHQLDCLKNRAGFINHPAYIDYKVVGTRIYSPSGQFVEQHELDNMISKLES